jgi:hypothetical protein
LVLISAAPYKEDHPLTIETLDIAVRLLQASQEHNVSHVLVSAAFNTWKIVLCHRERPDFSISHDYVRHFSFHLRCPTHP